MERYYQIQEDKDYINLPQLKYWEDKEKFKNIIEQKNKKEAGHYVMQIKRREKIVTPDILLSPVFMVTKIARSIINLYEPNIVFKEVILSVFNKEIQERTYYLPLLHNMDCLSDSSEYAPYHSRLIRIVLKREKVGDKAIFSFIDNGKQYIIMRLDLVETLLSRDVHGFNIQSVDIE